jgi:hypothetical protein
MMLKEYEELIQLELQMLTATGNLEDTDDDSTDKDSDDSDEDSDLEFLLSQYSLLQSSRYLSSRIQPYRRFTQLESWFNGLLSKSPRMFRLAMRMTYPTFQVLTGMIKENPVFSSPRRLQAPVHLQLAVFLYRLGMSGAGSSLGHTALALGLGEGSVLVYTSRVIKALHSLKSQWICWPSNTSRIAHAKRVGSHSVFKGCVGFIDGTFIHLQYTPEVYHAFYFNRKSTYAINAMAVCTDKREVSLIYI